MRAAVVSLIALAAVCFATEVWSADRPVYCGTERWEAYITEAAARYKIPTTWIRAVMRAESAGCDRINGLPVTSAAGAIGLMQVMPATWRELRQRLSLGLDPYDPHDNILAGAAYLRELYDRYRSPGFLAAYQAGPERYDQYLVEDRPLPLETLEYIDRVERIADAATSAFLDRKQPDLRLIPADPKRRGPFVHLGHESRGSDGLEGRPDVQQ